MYIWLIMHCSCGGTWDAEMGWEVESLWVGQVVNPEEEWYRLQWI